MADENNLIDIDERGHATSYQECNREAIHTPNTIQSHGVLLAVSAGVVERASDNWNIVLEENPLGERMARLFPKLISIDEIDGMPAYIATVKGRDKNFNVFTHRQGRFTIFEFEPEPDGEPCLVNHVYPIVRTTLSELHAAQDIQTILVAATKKIQEITEYDRVVAYRFDKDGHGMVVAETRSSDKVDSYLGLLFPATDIPQQARRLYVLNRTRAIIDVDDPQSVIQPDSLHQAEPLDLSNSMLRSVSRVHIQYLKNMGARSSMSFSIIGEGKLWGMISCHHRNPHQISFEQRTACDLIAQAVSSEVINKEHSSSLAYALRLKTIYLMLIRQIVAEVHFVEGLAKNQEHFLSLVNAQGAYVCFEDREFFVGRTPPKPEMDLLLEWLKQNHSDGIFATDCLAKHYDRANEVASQNGCSGLIFLPVSEAHNHYVVWFRPEVIHTVNWSGNPNKPIAPGSTHHLSPRKSFEAWKEIVYKTSKEWRPEEMTVATDLKNALTRFLLHRTEEMELKETKREAEEANRTKDKFLAMLSHEMATPLNSTKMTVAAMRVIKDETHQRKFLDIIENNVAIQTTLINDLLDISKALSGKMTLNCGEADIHETLYQAIESLKPLAEQKGVRFELKGSGTPKLYVDKPRLMQVINNLAKNAIRYSPDGGVINVSYHNSANVCSILVQDFGEGFEPDLAEVLFEPFVQVSGRIKGELGLGLPISKKIVELHGGKIHAYSKGKGQGATFEIVLPNKKCVPEDGVGAIELSRLRGPAGG